MPDTPRIEDMCAEKSWNPSVPDHGWQRTGEIGGGWVELVVVGTVASFLSGYFSSRLGKLLLPDWAKLPLMSFLSKNPTSRL